MRYDVEDLQQLSDERVLVRVRASARGLASGVQIDGTIGHLWAMKARKVTRLDVYGTWADAVEAVGLSE